MSLNERLRDGGEAKAHKHEHEHTCDILPDDPMETEAASLSCDSLVVVVCRKQMGGSFALEELRNSSPVCWRVSRVRLIMIMTKMNPTEPRLAQYGPGRVHQSACVSFSFERQRSGARPLAWPMKSFRFVAQRSDFSSLLNV